MQIYTIGYTNVGQGGTRARNAVRARVGGVSETGFAWAEGWGPNLGKTD